jgi:hypothetical protein
MDISLIAWLLVAWLLCSFPVGLLVGRRLAGRPLLHGGFGKRRASALTRVRGRLTPETAITARISSYSLHGDPWAATAYRRRLRRQSRLGVRGSFGIVTADRGENGARPDSAA